MVGGKGRWVLRDRLKGDVEGGEWGVLKGAAGLIRRFKVENIIMEYSPGVPERNELLDDLAATVNMLVDLVWISCMCTPLAASRFLLCVWPSPHPHGSTTQCNAGFRIGHVNDKGGVGHSMDAPLASLEEVTLENLAYDVEDVRRLKVSVGVVLASSLDQTHHQYLVQIHNT